MSGTQGPKNGHSSQPETADRAQARVRATAEHEATAIPRRLTRLVDGFVPDSLRADLDEYRRGRLAVGFALGGLPLWVFYAFYLTFPLDLVAEGVILFLGSGLMVLSAVALRRTGSVDLSANLIAITLFAACISHALLAGGFPMHTLVFYTVIPFGFQLIGRHTASLVWGVVAAVTTVVLYAVAVSQSTSAATVAVYDRQVLTLLGLIVLLGVLAWTHELIRRREEEQKQKMQAELDRAHRLESAGAVAATLAHDFNNVLTVIQSYTGLLLDELPDDDPTRDDLEEMLASARRGAELTRVIKVFARSRPESTERFSLDDLLDESEPLIRSFFDDSVEVTVEVGGAVAPIEADRNQLRRVIVNLLVNSKEAMPDGGRLDVRSDVPSRDEIEPLELEPGDYVRLIVSDSGCGIDPSLASRIFEPFFTTKRPAKGFGLGLSTAYGIAHGMGGTITVDSGIDEGSTFCVYLPVADPEKTGVVP